MSKKIILSAICVALILILVLLFILPGSRVQAPATSDIPQDDTLDNMPMVNLDMNTGYKPLPDINPELIAEIPLDADKIVLNDTVFDRTDGLEKILVDSDENLIVSDGNGGYIAANTVYSGKNSPSDIRIVRYDASGDIVKEKTYIGNDYDTVCRIKFDSDMGIFIEGIAQSTNGDFVDFPYNTPFIAAIDADTLDIKWWYPIQYAEEAFEIAGGNVYVSERYADSDTLIPSVARLDSNGNKLWQTESLAQWLHDICMLKDGRLVIVCRYVNEQANDIDGTISIYSPSSDEIDKLTADHYGTITPTDDNGFISLSVRNVKTIPQPVYVSSIWYDTETVITKYSADYTIEWRKTYDRYKDSAERDIVIPQSDGSVFVETE